MYFYSHVHALRQASLDHYRIYLKPLSARFDRVTCEDESEREREKERTGERRIFVIVTITIVSCHLRLFIVVVVFLRF